MIEVRIRHEKAEIATYLCTVALDRVQDVIPTLLRTGVRVDYQEDFISWNTVDLSGEFIYLMEEGQAFYEVLISERSRND